MKRRIKKKGFNNPFDLRRGHQMPPNKVHEDKRKQSRQQEKIELKHILDEKECQAKLDILEGRILIEDFIDELSESMAIWSCQICKDTTCPVKEETT